MNLTISQVISKLPDALKQTASLQRDYREKRIAERSACFDAWRKQNPERAKAIAARAKSRRFVLMGEAIAKATQEELDAITALLATWKADPAWLCSYCAQPAEAKDRTADHVIAVSRGGAHNAANLKPACRRCNSRKGTKPYYFV